ncbi:hypothetical protein JOM56_007627, partial [Amanita muscaria]
MISLKDVLANLKSDKVKDRQEGLSAIRTVFEGQTGRTFGVNKKGENDPQSWLPVFQALFSTVLTEKLACTKKSSTKTSATAEKRVAEAASTIRWLTDKAVTIINKQVVRALFDHLTQIMVHRDVLFMPVALDYIKALKCLVSYVPHLDHMSDDLWVKLVEMGFNVVLGDPVGKSFWDGEMSMDVAMHEELYEDDDEEGTSTKKRRRACRDDSEPPQAPTSKPQARQNRRILAVSLEQIEFISLLAVLFRSPSAPFLSYCYDERDNNNHFAMSILNRLKKFLQLYPTDSSLLHDFLSILSATLSHLALNKRQEVEDFARATWDGLVGFWGVKDKRLKEGVVTVLRVLFHYITSEDPYSQNLKSSYDCIDGIRRLWNLLDAEADSRWGIDGLSFDSLRLQLRDEWKSDDGRVLSAFTTKTFRAGWHFDANQALSWAVLELQADCASKLYHFSESMQTSASSGTHRGQSKRPKLENPIKSLLSSITSSGSVAVRIYRLQTLLFIIERHWSFLHTSLRQDVLETLFQFVSYEDGGTQSWVLLCMASVAYAEGEQAALESRNQEAAVERSVLDSLWSHAIRRINVPLVSRAACHTAHVLLSLTNQSSGSPRLPLSSQRILSEVETLTKDIDVQGPLYPYDSVCAFLAQCLKVASQDVKLYRMHLEEKVLSWLVDNWKMTTVGKGQMPLHQVTDVLLLLESICAFNRKTDFVSQLLLPDCLVVHALAEEESTSQIRDFLLHARVPRFKEPVSNSNEYMSIGPLENDLVQPKGRERKVSAFFQRSLEILTMEWDLLKEDYARLTAETARRSLDLAVAALSFEALLIVNGVNADRRVTQSGARLVTAVTRALKEAPWTNAEKALVSLGLEPLVFVESNENDKVPFQVMVSPNNGTGIRKHILHRLTSHELKQRARRKAARMDFLRIIWQITDVQEQFLGEAMPTLRDVLYHLAGNASSGAQPRSSRAVVDRDDFEPIRAASAQKSSEVLNHRVEELYLRHIFSVCIGFLTVGPSLQSAAGEPTRDKELMTFILTCAEKTPDNFFVICPMILGKIRQRVLSLAAKILDRLLEALCQLLGVYAYSRSASLQALVIQVLQSTMDLWLTHQVSDSEVGDKILQLCDWLSGALRKKKLGSWSTRDAFSVFLDEYLERDPEQLFWSGTQDNESGLPTALLMSLNSDEDIRVRFRIATIVARLFSVARHVQTDPMAVYGDLRQHFTNNLDNFESMLTRTLALGNIMIISSEVRRGAYWHILETCFFVNRYSRHIEAVLNGVSQRMGLAKFSQLFDAYASQMAYSICKLNAAIHQLSPSLLGYRDRLECAEATFRSFVPSAVVENPQLFENHCTVLQKTSAEGINECFGDIVGLLIVMWLADPPHSTEGLESYLKEHTAMGDDEFPIAFGLNIDCITASVLKSLGDQDVSSEGSIAVELNKFDSTGASASAFERMARFRAESDFHLHPPNLPAHPTKVILEALKWIALQYPEAEERATTYHIMHQLFADIQSSPLINEQHRFINSLTLWIAVHHRAFKDLALLHSLLHGATSMLSQVDLARPAQSILDWAFRCYSKEKIADSRLSNVLIRIACYANEHVRNAQDTLIANLGTDILQWLDKQVTVLEDNEVQNSRFIFRPQILRALPAWSHQQSPRVAELSRRINAETLSSILNDHRITTNKFRIARRLRDQAINEGCGGDRFEKNSFWRLKECIPAASDLQIEDADAFAELLYLHKGRVDSFGTEQLVSESIRHKHWLSAKQTSVKNGDITAARDSIILGLLVMLDRDEPSQVHLAYQTLRWIMSVIPSDAFSLNTWNLETKDELHLLQRYRWTPRSRTSRHLEELHDRDIFIDSASKFPQWVSAFTILLSDILAASDVFFAQLTLILQNDIEFAEQILPILIHRLLRGAMESGEHLCKILLSDYFTKILSLEAVDVSCVRAIVDVVLHLRQFSSPETNDALAYNKWLDVNYLLLAKSALKSGAYTTALLFLELAAEFRNNTEEESVEEVLYEIYGHIDEPDGFYGIKSRDLHRFLIKRFHHENQWDKALRFHGAALESGSRESDEAEGLLEAFHAFGFDQLAIDILRGSSALANNVSRTSYMNYRLGWRTETWDLPDTTETTTGASLYHALRSIYRERDNESIERVVRSSLLAEVSRLRYLGTENLAEIREVTRDIMCLGEISRWRTRNVQARLALQETDINLWNEFVTIAEGFEFHDLESILMTRISLIRSAREKEERLQIGNMTTPFIRGLIELEKSCLVRLSEAARSDGQTQIALNAVVRAQRLEDRPSFNVSQEFANVLWLQKEDRLAPEFLKSLLVNSTHVHAIPLGRRASLYAQLGTWAAEACLEKPTDIHEKFFAPAIEMLCREGIDDCRSKATVYYQYAVFSDRQYHAILKSPDAIRWQVYVQRKTQEIERRQEELRQNKDLTRTDTLNRDQAQAQKLLHEDSEHFRKHNLARDTFLKQAIEMYSRCLEASDDFDNDAVIRLASLWFANFDDEQGIYEDVEAALSRVPSRKMIFLSHQLSARLSKPPVGRMPRNQANLQRLILRMSKEHPFHTLHQVYCLHPDRSTAGKRQPRQSAPQTQTDRMAAANDIFEQLKQDETSASRARDVEMLCDACLKWAVYPIKNNNLYKRKINKVPDNMPLKNIRDLKVPVLTCRTPIDVTMKYDNCVWIARYETTFETAGGVNLPKITICYGFDGQKYKQIFKGEGNDDLRQDAVMEQVFDLVNHVLHRDKETRRRHLKIRGYKVIPLSSQAGVIEFVDNTTVLREWLWPAHDKYHPGDIKTRDISTMFNNMQVQFRNRSPDDLHSNYRQLMERFRPVMRHFFTEKQRIPISWFTMRLNYTRSVASSSIIGHILGLGDRHISNILMDKQTGELVHIDLGIAFDQGKLLKLPERVPFRLTRDIVDGMGFSGTQGVFQRCAEETLRVLRENSEVIMTILEVFKHDPLHSWTASEIKLMQVQPETSLQNASTFGLPDQNRFVGIGIDLSSGSAEEAADRALSSVSRKLDSSLSVQCMVNELIAEATDIANLSAMFGGESKQEEMS